MIEYADFAQDISTGKTFSANNIDDPFHAASVSKLYIAAATLSLVESGQIKLNHRLKISLPEFHAGNYGTGVMRWAYFIPALLSKHTDFDLMPSPTLEELLEASIAYSDNLATLKIANAVGRERIQAILTDWRLDQTSIKNGRDSANITTTRDMSRFLRWLTTGRILASDNLAAKLADWLPTRKMPNHTGTNTLVAYKTGNAAFGGAHYSHVAGYLSTKNDMRSFAIFTSTKDSEHSRAEQRQFVANSLDWFAYQLD